MATRQAGCLVEGVTVMLVEIMMMLMVFVLAGLAGSAA
jgi:hypothetical protein